MLKRFLGGIAVFCFFLSVAFFGGCGRATVSTTKGSVAVGKGSDAVTTLVKRSGTVHQSRGSKLFRPGISITVINQDGTVVTVNGDDTDENKKTQ